MNLPSLLTADTALPSLFVVGLPRSLSTLVFHVARLALRLNEPTWTTDGEVMNVDRFVMTPADFDHAGIKYLRHEDDPPRFASHLEFLTHCTIPTGFIYKDVVHPFVISEYLSQYNYPVLFVDRPIPDVAEAMLARGWLYPAQQRPASEDPEVAMVRGLREARDKLCALKAETISFDDMISDEIHVQNALQRLFPDRNLPSFRYIDANFREGTRKILLKRESRCYARLQSHDTFVEIERNNSK